MILLCPGVLERNEAKSQQMVAEELSRIVQSELVELRQRNVAETTTRVRLENQLGGLKVCWCSKLNAICVVKDTIAQSSYICMLHESNCKPSSCAVYAVCTTSPFPKYRLTPGIKF